MAKRNDPERVSLDPLDPETALRALLQVKPEPKPQRRKRRRAKDETKEPKEK